MTMKLESGDQVAVRPYANGTFTDLKMCCLEFNHEDRFSQVRLTKAELVIFAEKVNGILASAKALTSHEDLATHIDRRLAVMNADMQGRMDKGLKELHERLDRHGVMQIPDVSCITEPFKEDDPPPTVMVSGTKHMTTEGVKRIKKFIKESEAAPFTDKDKGVVSHGKSWSRTIPLGSQIEPAGGSNHCVSVGYPKE